MKTISFASVLLLFAGLAYAEAPRYKADKGPAEVITYTAELRDAKRERDVPIRVYQPKTLDAAAPVILVSHGLGGSREGYKYLGEHWASYGYVCVHLQHVGSDSEALKDGLRSMNKAAADPRNSINRPLDVSFAIDTLEQVNAGKGPKELAGLKDKIDLKHIGVAGHSFGAYTVNAVVGLRFTASRDRNLEDKRISAALSMSSPVPNKKANADLDFSFGAITVPVLHMTGTKDDSPINDTKAAERRLPYDHSTAKGTMLVTFNGGDHMIFSGRLRRAANDEQKKNDDRFHDLIKQSSTAYFDWLLKDDDKAKAYLFSDFKTTAGTTAVVESK